MTTQIKGNATSTFGGNIDVIGNVVTDAPIFNVKLTSGNQSITPATWTKVNFNSVNLDNKSWFDSTTNYRYAAQTAGWYLFTYEVYHSTSGSASLVTCALRKNGTEVGRGIYCAPALNQYAVVNGTNMIYMNGTTDYVEVYGYIDGTSPVFSNNKCYFSGTLLRADS